jgi:hypothetical protein
MNSDEDIRKWLLEVEVSGNFWYPTSVGNASGLADQCKSTEDQQKLLPLHLPQPSISKAFPTC